MNDRFILGSVAGLVSSFVMILLNLLINLIPGISVDLLIVAANMFVPIEDLRTVQGNIMGFIIHLICGALLGVVFIYLIEITGRRYYYLKGMLFGIAVYFIMCGAVSRFLKLPVQDRIIDNLFMLFLHIPFGLSLAYVTKVFKIRS